MSKDDLFLKAETDIDRYIEELKKEGAIRQESEISLMVSVKKAIKKHYIED